MNRKACLAEGIRQDGLVLLADNGGPRKGATMLATLQNPSIAPSFRRPLVSDDNPYSENLFRTLKYPPLNWPIATGNLVKIDKLSKEVIYDNDQLQV